MSDALKGRMPVNASRLIEARKAKGWSQADLAERTGVSQQAIGKLEAGTAKSSKFIARIAAALDVEVSYIDSDYAYAQPVKVKLLPPIAEMSGTIPLYVGAEGGSGNGYSIISTEPVEYLPRPYILENVKDAYAILIEGDSMEPAFEAGDMAWVNPMLGPRREHDVIIYLVDEPTGERRAVIKRLVSWTDTHWTLRQHNPPSTFKLERDPWRICHRVIGKLSKR